MVRITPPPPSIEEILDQVVAKASGRRMRRRLDLPATAPRSVAKKETLRETFRRLAPLLLPWVFVRRFCGALGWVRADDMSAQGRDEEALRLLRTLPPEMQARASWKVDEIRQLEFLQWDKETIEKANAFLLERVFERDQSDDDRYLTCFAQWLAQLAFLRLTQDGPVPSLFDYEPAKIDLLKVEPRLKRRYPLRIHPDWKDD